MHNRFRAKGSSQVMVEVVAQDQVDKYGIADCKGAAIKDMGYIGKNHYRGWWRGAADRRYCNLNGNRSGRGLLNDW